MAYTALYRRLRPLRFADLVGQEHISRTLANAVREHYLVHAYLFAGPRGTGKTSTARILARAVNCLSPENSGEPCGVCAACLRHQQGEAMDILEIDAASNRGIDEMRDLRERVKYAPALEKYKVYIIDEAHMLTTPAFNALLKTLEEPPPQVLFILATTEPHKLPLTVLSRCQRFDFRRIPEPEVCAYLAEVAAAEKYQADPAALAVIARRAEGGMRDALGLLDQCAGFTGGQVTLEALNRLIGATDAAFIAELTRLLLAGEAAPALTLVAQLYAEGHDLRQFLYDMLEYQRELLLQKLSPSPMAGGASLPHWAEAAAPGQLLRLIQALAEGDNRLRVSLQPRLTLELALLQACGLKEAPPPAAKPVGEMAMSIPAPEQQNSTKAGKTKAFGGEVAMSIPTPEQQNSIKAGKTKAFGGEVAMSIPAPEQNLAGEGDLAALQELWPRIMADICAQNGATGAFLDQVRLLSLQQDQLKLGFSEALFMKRLTGRSAARELIEQTISRHFGRRLMIEGILLVSEQAESKTPPPEDSPQGEQGSIFAADE